MISTAIAVHLFAAAPALLIGGVMLARRKGTTGHKRLGRFWAILMVFTAMSSFWIQEIREGFSIIHVLSIVTLVSVTAAILAIRRGKVQAHRKFMIGAYCGSLAAAAGTLAPGRIIGSFVFGG